MKRRLLLMGLLAVAAGCQKTESNTEIVLEISSNIPVPAGMDTLYLQIGSTTNPQALANKYPLGTDPGQFMRPRRMTLVPTKVGTVFTVLVEGRLGGKTVVSRSVITSFAKGESKLLKIELLQKCVGQVCPNNQTCTPSAFCADPHIDPATLPTFDPSQDPKTPGLDPDAGTTDAPVDLSGDGKNDSLPGKDGSSFDGQPGADNVPTTPDGASPVGPDGLVPVPDGSTAVDAPTSDDGPVIVKLDTGSPADAPSKLPDVPPSSKTTGVACGLSGECESGLCVDGVCCESKCDGMCMACNVPGKLGTCALVPLNDPSGGDCPDDGIATCGRNGKCDGQGGCMMYPSGMACSAETCPTGTSNHTRPGLCDGQGHCAPGQVQDCTPFLCNPTSNLCNPTCTSDADCVAPNQCIGGSCGKKSKGLPCSSPSDCQSNVCAQGVCCAGPCSDLCKSCAVEGSLGTCSPVPAGKPDVQSRCLDQGVATCGSNGLCDGAGACQKYGDSLTCAAQCNATTAMFTTSTCSAGACASGAPQSCAPYSCDNNGCKKSCTSVSDCAPGFVCGAGGLCVRPPEDCMNGSDDDGDGLVDCADPDCQAGFMCVPTVPTGFTGPVEVFDGPEASMPSCGGAYPVDGFKGWGSMQCPAVTCNPCRCDTKGVTCGSPSLGFYTTTSCLPKPGQFPAEDFNKCMGPVSTNYTTFVTLAAKPTSGCAVAGGDPVVPFPTVTWNAARVCGAQGPGGKGCGNDAVCWPKPQGAYRPQACVVGDGNLTCPTSGYTDKHDYYNSQAVDEGRTCVSSCDCGTLSGGSCQASIEMFQTSGLITRETCTALNRVGAEKFPSACADVPGKFNYYRVSVPDSPFVGGSCPPTGDAVATGGCTPKGSQTTVCCTP